MPIYEYQCTNCGHELEAMQKMSDQPLVNCPECHQASLTKLISAAGFQLKGSGWYVTDYSAKGKAKSMDEAKTTDKTAENKSTENKSTENITKDKKASTSTSTSTKSTDTTTDKG